MHATTPPTENALALRKAIMELAHAKLAPLLPDGGDLDALPAWLWSLPAHDIARSLVLDAPFFALEIARKLEAETARRHPADRFVAYLAERHPHLSHVQRARLAEFAQALTDLRRENGGERICGAEMQNLGFSWRECELFKEIGGHLIDAVDGTGPDHPGDEGPDAPLDRLRAAGERAHARRAFADGELEISPVAVARVNRIAKDPIREAAE